MKRALVCGAGGFLGSHLEKRLRRQRPVGSRYQLAADMGEMGFMHSAECEIMRNSALININMIDASARTGIGRYFFCSSVCVYRDMAPGEPELSESEEEAYPALPGNKYGWEKLYTKQEELTQPIQASVG